MGYVGLYGILSGIRLVIRHLEWVRVEYKAFRVNRDGL